MDDKIRMQRGHKFQMEDRKNASMTGVVDVVSFDTEKIILESDCGIITIKGSELHVKRLSVEKKEIDLEGMIDSVVYTEGSAIGKKGESIMGRIFR